MAAGIGSRFGTGIKQLEPVDDAGHIIMDYSIHDAIEAGFKGGREKMSNGEHEIRTPKGLRIGNRSVVDGKNMLQIKRGGCEDYISAESLVEYIHGLPVKNIEFATPEDCRKEA